MKNITLYTDGACSGNPGPGGWGAVLVYKGHELELAGGTPDTTNNRMELTAVIEGLSALNEPCEVSVFTDSQYIVDAMQKRWVYGWRAKGWKRSNGDPALNPDLWERLLALCETHKVTFTWVKGHADNDYNNRCDRLAVAESKKF